MTEPTNIIPDPLDMLLGPPAPGGGDETLRRRLLERTTLALRRRRRISVVLWAAALAACYVLGLLTMLWLAPRRVEVVQVQAPPAPAPQPPAALAGPATSAVALEWKAFDDQRPDLYRQAGDRYLREDADPASAVRCYGQSLNGASDKDLAISPDDDFLLMMLKEARLKEKDRAKRGS